MQVLVNKEATAAFAIYEFVVHSCYFPGYFFVGNEVTVLDIADEMVGLAGNDILGLDFFWLIVVHNHDVFFRVRNK